MADIRRKFFDAMENHSEAAEYGIGRLLDSMPWSGKIG
jgi:hypothetical protein